MKVSIGQFQGDFQPWKPELSRVFGDSFAFDTETTLIDPSRDWLAPAFVLGAAYDGQRGYFLTREHVATFFQVHRNLHLILHHAPFDLAVIHSLAPELDIYSWVDRDLVWDTQLLHRLLTLGTAGHTARGQGQSTLESCASQYLGLALAKHVQDSEGHDVRVAYSKWLNRSPNEIDAVYLDYLAKDVVVTFRLFGELIGRLQHLMQSSDRVWGYVSPAWLTDQVERWGYQTHHIQLKAAIVLRAIKTNGLWIDQERREVLVAQLTEVANECRSELRREGFLPGQPGSIKALQEILQRLERKHPELEFPKTSTGKFVTRQETLEDLADVESFIQTYLKYKTIEKLQSSFVNKLGKACVHPSFDPLMVSGRTSSFGEINAQNLPRDDRVRSCFIPSSGNVFIDADYTTVEMATLSQVVQSQFGLPSEMAVAINAGRDLHTLVAARVTGKTEHDVTSEERRKAKPINFGKPGGMGDAGLQRYARASYGVELSAEEVEELTRSWLELFPEMNHFLARDSVFGEDIARHFALTPLTYAEVTGSRNWLNRNPGLEVIPNPILGWMFRKVLLQVDPRTRNDEPYSDELIDYCWRRAAARIDDFSAAEHADILAKRPSIHLAKSAARIVELKGCFTLTGRLRANASFCARHNTLFQGLAADGAKLGLWRLWRSNYRIVNFIHDEVLIEIPEGSNLHQHADSIRRLMIEGMQEVVPDVQIAVKCSASRRWYKDAQSIVDDDGQMLLWEPGHLEPATGLKTTDGVVTMVA